MSKSVGSELLNEIERVTAKRERWKKIAIDEPSMAGGLSFGISAMTVEINAAKEAVQSADPIEAIRCLEALRGYDSND